MFFIAASLNAHGDNPETSFVVELHVLPQVCTLAKSESYCVTDLHVAWEALQPASLCLRTSVSQEDVYCWNRAGSGEYHLTLRFDDDLRVELHNQTSNRLVAASTVTIAREATLLRRKRRNPWNLFD